MKTKNIMVWSLMALATLGTTSCKDSFLDVTNPGADPIEEYYVTDKHIQEAVVAVYDPLHWPDWGNGSYAPLNISSDIMGDDMNPGGASASDMLNWQLMSNYKADANNTMAALWTDEFSGVKRANDALGYIKAALNGGQSDLTAENAKKYEAQVRTLRAYFYMNLWKYWGNIPYFETNLSGNYLAPQIKADEVYANVIKDLEATIALDALPMKAEGAQEGRVTKAFAYMVYAELVMYQKDKERYPQALKYMKEIIDSGNYSLMADFKAIWEENNEWSSESIFEINYNDDNHSRGWSSPLAVGGTVLPRLMGPRGWSTGKGGVDTGWGFGTLNESVVKMYDANDARLEGTCWNADEVAKAEGIEWEHGYAYTGYFLYKYLPRPENNKDAGWDVDLNFNNNYRVYRYAETLLNAAELTLLTGGSAADAAKWLNMVRKRAGISEIAAPSLDDVLNERHKEFVGEGKRYWDLVRSDKAASVLVPNSGFNRTNSWTPSKKYLPIPQGELSADPNLVQNQY